MVSGVHRNMGGTPPVRLVEFHPGHLQAQLEYLRQSWPKGPMVPALAGGATTKAAFTRWSCTQLSEPFEIYSDVDVLEHVLTFPLRDSNLVFDIGSKSFVDGGVIPGNMYLTGPTTQKSRAIYREPFDTFRIYLANDLINEAFEGLSNRHAPSNIALFLHQADDDKVLHHLAMAALATSRDGDNGSVIYLETIALALAVHLVSRFHGTTVRATKRSVPPLADWRLKRVLDYIEVGLTDADLSLGTLSAIAGLSRMHFAAQFRAATGFPPHTYVVRRKIERARELLMGSSISVEHVSLALGFKSDVQFVRAFRKIVGLPPGRWRRTIASS